VQSGPDAFAGPRTAVCGVRSRAAARWCGGGLEHSPPVAATWWCGEMLSSTGQGIRLPASPFMPTDYINAALGAGFEIRSCAEVWF